MLDSIHSPLPQPMIHEHEPRHRLDHGDGAGEDARVVATAGLELGGFAGDGDGLLRLRDGGGGLEGDAEDDVLAVGDAALDAAAAVGRGANAAALLHEGDVVL